MLIIINNEANDKADNSANNNVIITVPIAGSLPMIYNKYYRK